MIPDFVEKVEVFYGRLSSREQLRIGCQLLKIAVNQFESLGLDTVQGFDQIQEFIDIAQKNQEEARKISEEFSLHASKVWNVDRINVSMYVQQDIVRIMSLLLEISNEGSYSVIIEYFAFVFNCLLNPPDGIASFKALNILCDRPEGYEMVINILSDLTKS